jgi:hypothetical protein
LATGAVRICGFIRAVWHGVAGIDNLGGGNPFLSKGRLPPVIDVVSHNWKITVTYGVQKLSLSTAPVDKPVDLLLAVDPNGPKHDSFVRLAKF